MKNKIIIGTIAVLVLAGVGSAVAMGPLWNQSDPEAAKLADAMSSGKLQAKDVQALEKAHADQVAWQGMTQEDRVKKQSQSLEQFKKDQALHPAVAVASANASVNPFMGVLAAKDAPMPPAGYNDFRTYGYWGGTINGEYVGVRSGATQKAPHQGAVLVSDSKTGVGANIYNTPAATGPVEIVSEANGVLTLKSVAASLDVYDEAADKHGSVTTKGGVIYKFDTKTRSFVK